ncbi:hypothetical protein [Hymenobacter cavernae]|uniref:Uncharacterized protein n=1 Tax=Hymenobacter cavernae TaxID=2044852 RepID=A0ABQ1UMR1_9BACT|nr:hypothetical protein [Hymenobacter cavernae]GGF22240.1 hypothetical protein GCM10011383_37340 [Hymenobacter cavernae]
MASREDLIRQEQLNQKAIIEEMRKSDDQAQRDRAERLEQQRKNQEDNYKK